jgi:hypothetical protein
MEKIVADLDFHGCLLRGARPNRILNRYDRKRERDRGQSAFCVPINHFSPPPYPMNRSPSSLEQAVPYPRSPAPYGSTTRVPCVKECRGHCCIQTDPLPNAGKPCTKRSTGRGRRQHCRTSSGAGLGFREVDRSRSPAYRGRVHGGKSSSASLTHTNGIPC